MNLSYYRLCKFYKTGGVFRDAEDLYREMRDEYNNISVSFL